MKAAKYDSGTFEMKLARFLLMYRNTPNSTTAQSPAQLLFHRTLRTRLSLLTPNVSETVVDKQASQKAQHDKKGRERQFEVNQHVLVENPKGDPKWIPGIITERLSAVSYKVKVDGKIWSRHVDQLLASSNHGTKSVDDSFDVSPNSDVIELSADSAANASNDDCATTTSRYPQRDRHPPVRYDPSSN